MKYGYIVTQSVEIRRQRPKQQSIDKVLDSIFSDSHRIVFIDYLEHGETINEQ